MNFTVLLSEFLPKIQHLGMWGYWIALAIAFLESMAFVGTFVPGSTAIMFIGFLSAQGYLDPIDLMWFVAIGAILGDWASYYLGTKGTRFFKDENRFLKESHLDAGQRFFVKHGNKSVFFGRFLAPIRSIVPFIAGLSKMKKKSFFFWSTLSGVCWSVFHVLLGYFFGDATRHIRMWSSRIGILVIILAVLWYIYIRKRKAEEEL